MLPGILLVWIGACKNDPGQIRALTGKAYIQEDRATNVTVIYSQEGKVTMRLFAKDFIRNEHAKRPYIDMNNGLKVEFYNDSGVVSNTLTADSSRYYDVQGDIIVWDSVQIVSNKGEKLNTDELIWNEKMQKFFTEKPVRITTPNQILYGDGMEANRDFTWYRITYPKGSVRVNKGEMPQ
jgi:LPS export ABC transporter protein LptC